LRELTTVRDFVAFHYNATQIPTSDLRLSLSVSPTTATTGGTVNAAASLTNTAAPSRVVTLKTTFSYVSPGGTIYPVQTSTTQVTIAAGQTLTRSGTFNVTARTPRGTYSVLVVATDSSGSTGATAQLTVY
jgi:hypothetical protein